MGRKTRAVMIQGLTAPGLNDSLGPQSRDNLAGVAGKIVRVETTDRPIGTNTIVGTVFGDTAPIWVLRNNAGPGGRVRRRPVKTRLPRSASPEGQRGRWDDANAGSHWWHFNAAADSFPQATKVSSHTSEVRSQESQMFDWQTLLISSRFSRPC